MRAFYALARMRVLDVLRSPSSAIYFLVAPVLILVVVAVVFINGQPFERRHVGVVAGADAGAALVAFPEVKLEEITGEPHARARIHARALSAAVVRDGAGWKVLAAGHEGVFGRGLASALSPPVSVETVTLARWSYVHYVFPGVLSFAVLVSGLYGMGYAMARYRQNQFLKKLATTPLGKGTFIAAQVAARALLILLQMILLVAAAALLLELPVTVGGLLGLTLFTVVGLVTFMGLGFVLACTIRSDALLSDVVNGLLAPLVLCSDMFFPVTELPRPLADFAALLPTTQLVRAGRALLLEGVEGIGSLLPELAILVAWLVAAYVVSWLVFRWHE